MSLLHVLLFASPNGRVDTFMVSRRYHGVMQTNESIIKSICNQRFGKEKQMSAYAPFYVEIKTENDKELIPCADLETAEYCLAVLKKYGFKDNELHLLGTEKEDKKWKNTL